MHIKKLEICGFKSFVDRTVIHFDHDVIGVVGPNGCGKSNVVDAIRWVLGEQSAKALRGKGMADVIFNGSESRPQAGFAEVTITFDNSDPAGAQQLPLEYRDYPELAVTRRIYKGDGANEYFINKTAVRLRDVSDVFLGTGVGRKAYSIVEQGKIGLIVSARPEDRRVLIEEAAGITKYKARKKQAETKMDLTRQNLTRVNDIVSEIERQIGTLRRQAAKAERYVKYRDELDDLALWDASHRLLEFVVRQDVSGRLHVAAHERAQRERTAADVRDAELEVLRQEALDTEAAAARAQTASHTSDSDAREWETTLDRATERYAQLDKRLASARLEQASLEERAVGMAVERDALASQLDTFALEKDREEAVVREQAEKLDTLRIGSERSARELLELRRRHGDAGTTIARAEASLAGFEQRTTEMQARKGRLSADADRLAAEEADLATKRESLAARATELAEHQRTLAAARDAAAGDLPTVQRSLAADEQALEQKNTELHRKKSRLHALEELARRLEGVGAGVRTLLATGDSALGGLIADRVEVPAALTQAFAALVGDRLECVIVDDAERAVGLLQGLASARKGRASLIPRTVRAPSSERPALEGDAPVRFMLDAVRFAPEDEAVLRALIGNALVADTSEEARRLFALGVDSDVVTLDGTVFHADGRITGGAGDGLASGMLEQKREMRELVEVVAALTEDVSARRAALAAGREHIARLREGIDEAKSKAHQGELASVTATQDLRRLEQQLSVVTRRLGELGRELTELEAQMMRAEEQHVATLATLAEATSKREQIGSELEVSLANDETARTELLRQQALVTERKVALASVRERAQSLRSSLERVAHQLTELRQRIGALESERSANAVEAGRVASEMMGARAELYEARNTQRQARAAAERARMGLDDVRHDLALREAELRQLRGSLDEATSELNTHELELHRLGLERTHLEEAIREKYRGLELARVVGDFHARPMLTNEQRGRIKELSTLIERMGPVNLDAMREFEESSKRFDYYTSQREDLLKALADLTLAIEQMNRESKRLFRHAFDGINRRFIELFPKMFRGGKAELRLTNPDDVLETGIDIVAQPPGKRLANIELMSGGEKAFTAVSLLFAIFRYKPSPFCILDEVDAPLDDANIDRYVEAIRAMTDRSQFILITHSKQSMQAVDVLYGVTMQEPGVSKLVGVRVNEATQRSEHRREQRESEALSAQHDASTDVAVA